MIFFMVLAKVHFQGFLCKRLFRKMYLYEDRGENRRGSSKAPKYDKYMFKLYKDRVGPAKDKGLPKSTAKN